MQRLNVNLSSPYPIFIGQGILGQSDLFLPYCSSDQILIVTNHTIAQLHLTTLIQGLPDHLRYNVVELQDGEIHKNLTELNRIFDALLENKHLRNTTLLALGGGVVGDMTGFAAACYQRGVGFIQMPTTLLAQVDSSVGGKTGINHRLGKNMIGAFHQPRCVMIDTNTLKTLPDREYQAGLAEVVKYGLIQDADFFNWLEAHQTELMDRDPTALNHAIYKSCEIKAGFVIADEKEQGIRAHLNLGHTFGHAIETTLSYGEYLHGEAIAIGIVLAAKLSKNLGFLSDEDVLRIECLLQAFHLPTSLPSQAIPELLLAAMQVDKKRRGAAIRLILLEQIGQACITENISSEEIIAIMRHE